MKVSYTWLQEYFKEKLPPAQELAQLFTMYAFEVESVEKKDSDHIFDVKILPNRAHDCLSHRGIAREIGTLLSLKLLAEQKEHSHTSYKSSSCVIETEKKELSNRQSAAIIRGVSVKKSPAWLAHRLEALGQKSINNIVDATNYVMFSIGQPIHAFDLAHIHQKDGIYRLVIRDSKEGEVLEVLGGQECTLPQGVILISDENVGRDAILDISGILGSTRTEVTEKTTDLLILSANFNPVKIRTAAKKLGLRTEASVRFENGITTELTMEGLQDVCRLIVDIAGGNIEAIVDIQNTPYEERTITLAFSDIEALLGFSIERKQITSILRKIGCTVHEDGENCKVTVPAGRLDMAIKEDVIEEIGRVYGFFNVPPREPKMHTQKVVQSPQTICVESVARALVDDGFDEVYTYTFRDKGYVELQNPIARDKNFFRQTLITGIQESLVLNTHNALLLGLYDAVKIFEIGTVCSGEGEYTALCIGIVPVKKVKNTDEFIDSMCVEAIEAVGRALGITIENKKHNNGVWEINLSECFKRAPATDKIGHVLTSPTDVDQKYTVGEYVKYKKISPYPFMLRDIAIFVPEGVSDSDVSDLITKEGGELLVSQTLFNIFNKTTPDGVSKTSYAYKLVFQSQERTLSNDEITIIMQKVTNAMNSKDGWQVR